MPCTVVRMKAVGVLGPRDCLSASLPEPIRTDWLRGDTIVGTFVQVEAVADSLGAVAAGDTARLDLESLTAIGNARSLYRMEASNGGADQEAVNYLTASRIELHFRDGDVATVETVGPVDGVHL